MAEQDTVEKVTELTFPSSKTYEAINRVHTALYELRDFFGAGCAHEFYDSGQIRAWNEDLHSVRQRFCSLENRIRFATKNQRWEDTNG